MPCPRRRSEGCVQSRERAGQPAGGEAQLQLERPAAGARGRGGAPGPAAAPGRRIRPAQRLRCVAFALPRVPGAARRAAAGPVRVGDGAESGGGGANPGGVQLVHTGALRLAAAVPRLLGGG